MPERVETTWSAVRLGDYVESQQDASLWKVTHEVTREDGRWLGLTTKDGQRRKVKESGQRVTVLIYGQPMEKAVDLFQDVLRAVPYAEKVGSQQWVHPSFAALEADPRVLRGHVLRFHGHYDETDEDLARLHRVLHQPGEADHDHQEGT